MAELLIGLMLAASVDDEQVRSVHSVRLDTMDTNYIDYRQKSSCPKSSRRPK